MHCRFENLSCFDYSWIKDGKTLFAYLMLWVALSNHVFDDQTQLSGSKLKFQVKQWNKLRRHIKESKYEFKQCGEQSIQNVIGMDSN